MDGSGQRQAYLIACFAFVSSRLPAIAWTGFERCRWEGLRLLALCGGYLWYLRPKS
jgi:hypothetical protein